jgi:putative PIN family toxin of toxin-antitoxin system
LKVFLDTNVLVSAFISHGLSAEIFRLIIKENNLIIGNVVLEELQRILIDKFNMPDKQVNTILQFLNAFEICKYSDEKSPIKLRDKDDEKILSLAIKSKSDVLVTGDKDLLDVRENVSIKILTPREFFEFVKQS